MSRAGRRVSGNRPPVGEPLPLKDYAVLLRAVATSIPATGLLYSAAALLTAGRNDRDRAYNRGVADMVAVLLGFPTDNPDLVERVLRNLPDIHP